MNRGSVPQSDFSDAAAGYEPDSMRSRSASLTSPAGTAQATTHVVPSAEGDAQPKSNPAPAAGGASGQNTRSEADAMQQIKPRVAALVVAGTRLSLFSARLESVWDEGPSQMRL